MSDEKRLVEQFGVHIVGTYARKIKGLFRQINEHDKGIDGEIELSNIKTIKYPFIGVQIKCRSKVVFNKMGYTTISVTQQNLDYWKNYGRPVILILCEDDNLNDLYWTRVDNLSNKNIKVFNNQKFDVKTSNELEMLLRKYISKNVMSSKLVDIEKVLGEVGQTVSDGILPIARKIQEYKDYIKNKDYVSAIKPLEMLEYLYEIEEIEFNLSICYFEASLFEKCIVQCNYNYEDEDLRINSSIIKAYANNLLGNYEESINIITKSIETYEGLDRLYNCFGLIEYWNGHDENAYNCFKLAIKSSTDPEMYFNFALTCCAMNYVVEAIDSYNKCIHLSPTAIDVKYDAFNNLGLLYKEIWRLDDSELMFKKAIKIAPEKYYAQFNLAYLYKDLGRNRDALDYYLDGNTFILNVNKSYVEMALLYCRLEKFQEASQYFTKYYESENELDENEGKKICFLDIGYEVAYALVVEVVDLKVQINKFVKLDNGGLFEGIDFMRKWSEYAQQNSITEPLPGRSISNLVDIRKRKSQNDI